MAAANSFQLDHVAIGVRALSDAMPFLVGELGGKAYEGGPGPGFTWAQWRFAGGARVELLEPLGEAGFLHRFLDSRGPGVHHVTFITPDLAAARSKAESLGYDVVGYAEYPGWKEAFLHPKQALGIVVQLAEQDKHLEEDWSNRFDWPPQPEAPEPAARIVGPRLRVRDRDRARRQWIDLLGAECRDDGDELVFRWPDSPLQIATSFGEGPEGPTEIRLRCDRALELPSGPHPVFGTAFVVS